MRSTVRIDDDLMAALKAEAARQNISLTRAINRALRAGIVSMRCVEGPREPLRQRTVGLGEARVDLSKALAASAALEDEESVRELALRK